VDRPGKSGLTVEEVIRLDLYGMSLQARGALEQMPPEVVANAIRASEDWLERELGTFFGVKRVVSAPVERGLAPDTYDVGTPAYNYDSQLFVENRWGQIKTDYRPVWEVSQFFFAFPGNWAEVYNAKNWVQIDHKFGHINIVPTGGAAVLATFNAWVMSVLAGGRSLPRSLFIDYTAGLDPAYLRARHADLLEALRMHTFMGLAGILATIRTGGLGSCSTSLDGLSQSESFNQGQYGPYTAAYTIAKEREKQILDTWKGTNIGVPFVVLTE
jgi:hypothetical protein